jgi:hypothetical protein
MYTPHRVIGIVENVFPLPVLILKVWGLNLYGMSNVAIVEN